jgi:hypothetical protein
MQLEYAKNPILANAEHTLIDLVIKWDTIDEEFPFTASPNDCEAHGRAIFEQAAAGAFGDIADHIPRPMLTNNQMATRSTPTMPSGSIPVTEA